MGSADDRRFEVLRAIVADFVSTKEPIGSKGARLTCNITLPCR